MAHLRRTAGDWKAIVGARPLARQFFDDVKAWVDRGCEFHRQRRKGLLDEPSERGGKTVVA